MFNFSPIIVKSSSMNSGYPNGYNSYINIYASYRGSSIHSESDRTFYTKTRRVFYLKSNSSSLQSSVITPYDKETETPRKVTITLQPYEHCWLVIV